MFFVINYRNRLNRIRLKFNNYKNRNTDIKDAIIRLEKLNEKCMLAVVKNSDNISRVIKTRPELFW